MHGSILAATILPGKPPEHICFFWPGVGDFFQAFLSQGKGAGQIKITTRLRTYGL